MNKSKIKFGLVIASAAMSLTLVACGKTADTNNSSSSTSAKATVSSSSASSAKASSAASSVMSSSAEEAARVDKAKANAKAVEDKMTVAIKDKTVDTYDKAAIAEAKASYEALTPEEKSYVPIEVVNNLTKAETDITAKEQAQAQAKAQAEAEEAARQQAAAEEAARQARQQEAERQQTQTQPSTDQGSGSAGGSGNWTAEDEAARAEGYSNAAEKRYCEENGLHPVTEEDLREWGIDTSLFTR